MSIGYTKVDAANRQAFYETLLTFGISAGAGNFQQELLDWRYARRAPGETLVALSRSRCIGLIEYLSSLLSRRRTAGVGP